MSSRALERFTPDGLPAGWNEVSISEALSEVDDPIEMRDDVEYDLVSIRRRFGGMFHRERLFGRAILTKTLRRVDEILDKLEDRWEQIALFEEIVSEINAGRTDEHDTGLDPTTELPFHGLMAKRVASSDAAADDALTVLTRSLVGDVRAQIAVVGFWENSTKQDELRKAVKRNLDDTNLFAYDDLDELALDLVALAKTNRQKLR